MSVIDFYYSTLRLQAISLLYQHGLHKETLDIKHLIEIELNSIQKFLDSIKEGE